MERRPVPCSRAAYPRRPTPRCYWGNEIGILAEQQFATAALANWMSGFMAQEQEQEQVEIVGEVRVCSLLLHQRWERLCRAVLGSETHWNVLHCRFAATSRSDTGKFLEVTVQSARWP